MFCVSLPLLLVLCWRLEVGAGVEGVVEPEGDFAGASVVMVDWEEEREKVLARGARCVSFNSVDLSASRRRGGMKPWERMRADQGGIGDDVLLVSFHDMAAVAGVDVAGG